jgi:uncharacterized protein (TIRG00374 family)
VEAAAPKARRAPPWSLLLSLALSAVLLVLAFRDVAWERLLETLRQGQAPLLALACVLLTISYFIRGLRWRVILSAERDIAPLTVFWATMAGYLGNSFLPARAGELIRSVLLARQSALSGSYVLATALLERFADVVALVAISLLVLAALGTVPGWLVTAAAAGAVVGLIGLIVLRLLPRFNDQLVALSARLPLPRRPRQRLRMLFAQFLLGLNALRDWGRLVGFAGLTVVIWLLDVVVAMVVGLAFSLPITAAEAVLLLAALGLASAVPSTPGYVGVFQFAAVSVLVPLGFTRDQALVEVIALQAVVYLVVIVWGAIGLWRLSGLDAIQTARRQDGKSASRQETSRES